MKILIADDEAPVREAFSRSLRHFGITEIREAEDGIEAYQVISEFSPDMVLADIKMPGMNGIELLAKVREVQGNVLFVFISGYDFFEYAQKAIDLGAFGYLLKPVRDSELGVLIEKAREKLAFEARQRQLQVMMRIKADEGREYMRRRFIRQLLTEGRVTDQDAAARLKDLDIVMTEEAFCVLVVSLDRYAEITSTMPEKEKELLRFSIDNIATELLKESGFKLFAFDMEDGQGYLLPLPGRDSAFRDRLVQIGENLINQICNFLSYSVTIGIGAQVFSLGELGRSYEGAIKAVMQRLGSGCGKVYAFDEQTGTHENVRTLDFKTEQELLACLECGDLPAATALVEELYLPFRRMEKIDAGAFRKQNFQLIMLLFKLLGNASIQAEELLGDEFTLYTQVNACTSLDEVEAWFGSKLELSISHIQERHEKSSRKMIDLAKAYIYRNYNRDITLESVAEHVHLSPTYFSRLFKQEMGDNFSDFVINYRIVQARELLKEGVYKANEVSRIVGFRDEKYFYKVFKKLTGFTPGEYKEM